MTEIKDWLAFMLIDSAVPAFRRWASARVRTWFDPRPHELSADCWCEPAIEVVP